jgi:hypothetical protein
MLSANARRLAAALVALVAPVAASASLAPTATVAPLGGPQVVLEPVQDNVLFSESQNSNGAGSSLFCGTTAIGDFRRSLLRFDVAGSLPAGATVTGAELRLRMTNTIAGNRTCSLHRATQSWGEGTSSSDTASGGGGGAAPTTGDATWGFRFYSTTAWTSAGGVFAAGASAATTVGNLYQTYSWSSPQMAADVQGWLDAPATNHGWILIGDESTTVTAKRFASRENATTAWRPVLEIEYAPATAQRFCDASDGALAACPCANPGAADAGCDIPQATGGVRIDVLAQQTGPDLATLSGTGFAPAGSPTAIAIRSATLDPSRPVVFGDGLRCLALGSLVRLTATVASGGVSTHAIAHGAMAGTGTFYYQIWFRSTPSTYCDAGAAFNLSGGITLDW